LKVGIISDTHGWLDPRVAHHFHEVDEIWHAGDIGQASVITDLEKIKPCKAVFGNIDSAALRAQTKDFLLLEVKGFKVLLIHIAGPFSSYNIQTRALIHQFKPHALVCGHSHILKVAWDKAFNLLYINPGAAGQHGFHLVRTIIRLNITEKGPSDFEVIELGKRSKGTTTSI
jgi:putative phosphoesterase